VPCYENDSIIAILRPFSFFGRDSPTGLKKRIMLFCASVVKSACLDLTIKAQRHKGKFSAVLYPHNLAKSLIFLSSPWRYPPQAFLLRGKSNITARDTESKSISNSINFNAIFSGYFWCPCICKLSHTIRVSHIGPKFKATPAN